MKSTFKKLPASAVELTVDMDLVEFKSYYARAFQAAKANIEIKGFRKGMAPDAVLEGAIDPKKLFDDAAERAIKTTLTDEAEKNAWTIIDRPVIEIKDTDKSFSYVAKFSIFPEVNIEGFDAIAEKERAALEKKKEKITVKEDETKEALTWLQNARAENKETTEGAQLGRVIEITVKSSFAKEAHDDRFVVGKGRFMVGFEDKLIGKKTGETVAFSIKGPADYWNEELRNKDVDFSVTINKVYDQVLPELDDTFAEKAGKFKTLAELKESIMTGIREEKVHHEEEAACIAALEAAVTKANIDIPNPMVEKIRAQDKEMTEEVAKRKIATHLVIYAIADKAGIRPAEEEIQTEIAKYGAGAMRGENGPIDAKKIHGYIYERLQQKKVYDYILKK